MFEMMKYLIMAATVFFIMPVIGCSERLNLAEITTRAITATTEVQSYRASTIETYTVDGKTGKSTYESEFAAPDRLHVKVINGDNWSESIFIGDRAYLRCSDIPQWCESPCEYVDPSSGATVGVQATLIPLEKELEPLHWLVDLDRLPDEEIDSVNCWHYMGRVDMDSYADMLQEMAKKEDERIAQHSTEYLENMRRGMISFELWVEKDSHVIRQLKSERRFTVFDPNTGQEKLFAQSTTKRLYDFNQPTSIEPPQT